MIPAATDPNTGPIMCSGWKLHGPEVLPLTYHSAYTAAGLNVLPRSGTLTSIIGMIGNDSKYAGNRFTSSRSGTPITVQTYTQTTADSNNMPSNQWAESYVTGSNTASGTNGHTVLNSTAPKMHPKKWAGMITVSFDGLMRPRMLSASRVGRMGCTSLMTDGQYTASCWIKYGRENTTPYGTHASTR